MEEKKLLCPYCRNDKFIRKAEAEIKMFDDGETIRDDVISEDYEDYFCAECDKKVTEEELIRE